tara:strand:- start:202 stop:663 length:462 start_codon:yes stop_codon:yes gene_type:complete
MEKLTKDILEIIVDETKTINSKVRGLNFLELLKASVIERLLELVNRHKFPLDQLIEYGSEIKEESRHIKISVNYFLNPIFITKKKIDNDSLFISLNEASNFDILNDKQKHKSLLIYKNTGLSLPKDTVINAKYNKNLFLIEITNNEYEQILTK